MQLLKLSSKLHEFLVHFVHEAHDCLPQLSSIFDLLTFFLRHLPSIQFLEIGEELHYQRFVVWMSVYEVSLYCQALQTNRLLQPRKLFYVLDFVV